MKCIFCGCDDLAVIDSRHIDDKRIKRRRECSNCHKRFSTYEFVERPILMVKKKGEKYEPFDRDKLSRGIYSAIKKRPINSTKVNEIIEYIENSCESSVKFQISSAKIGDLVMERLKEIDQVAYIRFASVYKAFNSVDEFIDIISTLNENNKD